MAQRDHLRLCFQLLPFLEAEKLGNIVDIGRVGVVCRLPVVPADVLAVIRLIQQFAVANVVDRGLGHVIHRPRERHGGCVHVRAIPCGRIVHVRLDRGVERVGQGLFAAAVRAQLDVDAPAAALGHGIRAVILRLHENGQRRALARISAAVAEFFVDALGRGIDALVAVSGQYVDSQFNAEFLRKRRQGIFAKVGKILRIEHLRLVVNETVVRFRHGGNAQTQREDQHRQ